MKYHQPHGVSDPNAGYITGNPAAGIMGLIPPGPSIEYPQRELANFITLGGFTPDDGDLTQLVKAAQSCLVNYAQDFGTVNSLQVTLNPPPYFRDGFIVRVKAAQSNTGPCVLNCNAFGARPIKRKGGADPLANDVQAGLIVTLVYNTAWNGWQLVGVGGSGARGELTGPKSLYVNFNIGNDANDGTANDASHALKNIQQVISLAFFYAPSQFPINIYVADSPSYTSFQTPSYQGPAIFIIGNEVTPGNVVVTGTDHHACACNGQNTMTISGVKVVTFTVSGESQAGFLAANGAFLTVHHTANGRVDGAVFEAFANSTLSLAGPHQLSGNCWNVIFSIINSFFASGVNASYLFTQGITFTVFCAVSQGGSYAHSTAPVINYGAFGPSIAGSRYSAVMNGTINVQGAGPNFFPGSTAGAVATGGQYA